MKKLRRMIALMAVLSVSTIFTGCGDDDEDNSGAPPQNNTGGNTGNRVNAPETLAGQTYVARTGTAGQQTITFTSGSTYTLQRGSQAPESGSFTATRSDDIYTIQLMPSNAQHSTVYLSFTGNGTGAYTLTREGQPAESGLFSPTGSGSTSGTTSGTTSGNTTSGNTTSGNTTSGNTTSGETTSGNTTSGETTSGNTTSGETTSGNTTSGETTSGNTTSGETTSGNTNSGTTAGLAPQTLNNHSTRVQLTGGPFAPASYDLVLSGGNSGTFQITNGSEGSGNYTYSANGDNATLTLNYTDPAGGDQDMMNMTFTSANSGSFTGTQKVSGPGGTLTDYNNFAGTFTNFAAQ
ncbi:MAG: hypothetical protein ACO1QB_11595 [Verrucomicrobiales bacterium]